jgi:hypothetical protein
MAEIDHILNMSPLNVTEIVSRQVHAMRSDHFEIGVLSIEGERSAVIRLWTPEEIAERLPWLKAQNAKGLNINIRPVGNHLTLLDDITLEKIESMKQDGFEPCCIVRTSPGNYQAWLDHGYELTQDDATHAAQYLAKRFGSDFAAAGRRHFGRLAGFTNRKRKHLQPNGYFPFVRLEFAQQGQYTAADRFEDELRAYKAALETSRPAKPFAPFWPAPLRLKNIEDFRADTSRYPKLHNADLAYAVYAISRGLDHSAIRSAIASRDLSHKGPRRAQTAYVERTLKKAVRDADPAAQSVL